jgi:glycine/D-amino acid oxidase-like deaminating enzyme
MRHVPDWLDRFPKTRRPSYPRLRGSHSTHVAIVGGGLTGSACALAFATAGVGVILLEADAIGTGATAGADGLLREGFGGSFQASVAQHGLRTTRVLWEGMRRGSLDLAATLRRLKIRCDLTAMDVLTMAPPSGDRVVRLRKEQTVRRDGGADASWITAAAAARETALEIGGAIRTRASAIDPYRACIGISAAAAARGAALYERSAVKRIKPSSRHVEITTDGGSIRADAVVIATGAPLSDLRALRRHLVPTSLYGTVTEPLPPAVRRQVGRRGSAVEDFAEPFRLARWLAEDRVMIRGGRQPEVPARLRDRALTQRTGQLMYELSLLYPAISGLHPMWSWDTVDYETVDGLPLIGPHRNFPRYLFAFTPSRHGAGLAWTAARLLVRRFQHAAAKADEAFGFPRIL